MTIMLMIASLTILHPDFNEMMGVVRKISQVGEIGQNFQIVR